MTYGNSAEQERFEKWIGEQRPEEQGMEQFSWADCWSAWQARAALSVCADGGKGEAVYAYLFENQDTGERYWYPAYPPAPSLGGIPVYTAPQAECAPRASDLEIQATGTLIAIGRLLTEAGFNPELRIIEAVREVIAKAAPRADAEKDAALTTIAHDILNRVQYWRNRGLMFVSSETVADELSSASRAILAANKEK